MKIWKIIKAVLLTICAILVAIFHTQCVSNVKYIVGLLILLYGIEQVVLNILNKVDPLLESQFFWGIIEILLGVILVSVNLDSIVVYSVWGVWAILHEAEEIREVAQLWRKNVYAIIDLLESVVTIVFSVMLLIYPTEKQVSVQVWLLIAELVTTGCLPFIDDLLLKKAEEKNKAYQEAVKLYEETGVVETKISSQNNEVSLETNNTEMVENKEVKNKTTKSKNTINSSK